MGHGFQYSSVQKKNSKHFVGQIIEEHKDQDTGTTDFTVKFLRKCGLFFQWPEKEDISTVDKDDIVIVLPEPAPGRRGQVIFKLQFDGYNVQQLPYRSTVTYRHV